MDQIPPLFSPEQEAAQPKAKKHHTTALLRNGLFGVLLLLLGGVAGYRYREYRGNITSAPSTALFTLINTQPTEEYQAVNFQQFWAVWKLLEQQYVDPTKVQTDKMVHGAIKGMTAALGDPYTVYLPPADQKRTQEDLQGSFFGVGVELGYVESLPAVMSVIPDMPAAKAGVQAKDVIIHVTDEQKKIDLDTTNMSLDELVGYIRGERGTSLTLTLFRKGDGKPEPFKVTLQRQEIVVPSLTVAYIERQGSTFAHIKIAKFGERTQMELNDAILELQKKKPKVAGIVLDMRNNPGGLLESGIQVASEFIRSGLLVTQQGRFSSKDYTVVGTARLSDYPLVVLVNGGSASAAEIVAGALRDRKDAKIVGEKTFGKGTVQDALELENGAGLHVTIAKWLLPKGEWIDHTGIPVTVEAKDDPQTPEDEAVDVALGVLTQK